MNDMQKGRVTLDGDHTKLKREENIDRVRNGTRSGSLQTGSHTLDVWTCKKIGKILGNKNER